MKPFSKVLFIALFLVAVAPVFAQVAPAAQQGGGGTLPIVVGTAYSNFSMDWGPGHRSSGITAWVDIYPFPKFLRDAGFEAEGRSSRWGNPIQGLRQDTAQLGGIYTYRGGWNRIHPYGKFMGGIGSMDFPAPPGLPNYKHDTFTVTSASGGAEVKATGPLRIRAEYQYQWWHNVFVAGHTFTPNGITVGAQWDFRRMNSE